MNQEVNLDDLKRAWNSQTSEKTYSTDEIFKILKRKSITSVKWVFIISLIELLGGVVAYIILFSNVNLLEYHEKLMFEYGNWAYIYEIMNFIAYGVTGIFIYKFFKSYQAIKVHSSVKALSNDIISFRKVVRNFIYFNLAILFSVYIIVLIPVTDKMPELQNIDWFSAYGLGVLVGLLAVFIFMMGILWLYYYLVYGTFLRRLKRNLKNLDSIEKE